MQTARFLDAGGRGSEPSTSRATPHIAQGSFHMSSTSDKIKGYANEAIGNVKQGVGKLVGSDKLRAEGKVQEVTGEAQQTVGNVKGAVEDAYDSATSSSTTDTVKGYANEAAGKIKQGVGRATGSLETEADGIAQEVKGDAQKASGTVKRAFDR